MMRLKSIIIENFKGLEKLDAEFGKHRTIISGRNGVGKSSILDAWLWLIAGVDSFGRTKFNVRPIGSTADIFVKAVIESDDGEHVVIKRQAIEDGKNKNYFEIDSFTLKESDYKEEIQSIVGCDLTMFKELSTPSGFTSAHWTEQRKILMLIADPVDDSKLANEDLFKRLQRHTIDELVKQYEKDVKESKKKVAEIPIRIDEDNVMNPEKKEERIEQLRTIQKGLAQIVANSEKRLFQCEEYRKNLCEAVTDSINSKFPDGIRFELFDPNGKQTCEVSYNGVRFSTLSTGQRIKVGAEIVKALQNHFGIEIPLWIDNAESLSDDSYVTGDAQTIRMYVDEGKLIISAIKVR